jgi:hypothetical protein
MKVTYKAGAPYDYMTPRPTRDRDFAAQRILLMRLLLGDTAYYWFMEAVYLALSPLCGRTIRAMIGSIGHTSPLNLT